MFEVYMPLFFLACLVFEVIIYKSMSRKLIILIGLGKLTRYTNDVNFIPEERDFLVSSVSSFPNKCLNSFLLCCFLVLFVLFVVSSYFLVIASLILLSFSLFKFYKISNLSSSVKEVYYSEIKHITTQESI